MYRVLVVDDEKLERDGIRFLLSMEEGEWEIYEAANGKLALNELRKHPVDLMLTDIKMPHMDGLELSKKAREEYPDLEIIIFSGYGDFAFAQEAIRYGVTDYVLKPVDPDRFHDTIQKIQKEIASRRAAVHKRKELSSAVFSVGLHLFRRSGASEGSGRNCGFFCLGAVALCNSY